MSSPTLALAALRGWLPALRATFEREREDARARGVSPAALRAAEAKLADAERHAQEVPSV
jgi:hypothetical protein